MAISLDLADPGVLTVQLIRHGEKLPPALEAAIVASREPAVTSTLLEIMRNENLIDDEGPGGGWAPVHAARLLCARREETAIVPLLATMVTGAPDEPLAAAIERHLPELGAPVLEPALRALAELGSDVDVHIQLINVLSGLGVRDERVYQLLVDELAKRPDVGAVCLERYGDPRAIEHLARTLDALVPPPPEDFMPDEAVPELTSAILKLGGTLTPAQQKRRETEWAAEEEARGVFYTPSAPVVRPPRPGRNEPCWCGSGQKYKKCHLAEDEAAGRT